MARHDFLLPTILLFMPGTLPAQLMQLGPGAMVVAEGTRIALDGPLTWHISEVGTLVNHGLIDLGNEATLVEETGNPVTGTGEERAHRTFNTAFSLTEPGGLGLEMACLAPIGDLTITRGHQPLVVEPDEGVESVARWFRIDAAPWEGVYLDLYFHYDPSELNGLTHDMLMLHKTIGETNPWIPLGGTPLTGQPTVAAWDYSPWDLVTAFHFDVVTGVQDEALAPGFHLWPTLASEQIHLRAVDGEQMHRLELFDATGRNWPVPPMHVGGMIEWTMSIQHLPAGMFLLRINGVQVKRFIKT